MLNNIIAHRIVKLQLLIGRNSAPRHKVERTSLVNPHAAVRVAAVVEFAVQARMLDPAVDSDLGRVRVVAREVSEDDASQDGFSGLEGTDGEDALALARGGAEFVGCGGGGD